MRRDPAFSASFLCFFSQRLKDAELRTYPFKLLAPDDEPLPLTNKSLDGAVISILPTASLVDEVEDKRLLLAILKNIQRKKRILT